MLLIRMTRASARRRSLGVVALAAIATAAAPRAAHEKGVLRIPSPSLLAGDSLAITGTKFSARDEVTLALVGTSGRRALADVPTDSLGAFRRTILVPADLVPGRYRLVAEAIDGDEVAALDVVVTPAASDPGAASAMPGMAHDMSGMAGHDAMNAAPTATPVDLIRARSAVVTMSAAGLIILCSITGLVLLRQPHPAADEDHR